MRRPPLLNEGPLDQISVIRLHRWMRTLQSFKDDEERGREPGDPIPLDYANHSITDILQARDRWGIPRIMQVNYSYMDPNGRQIAYKVQYQYDVANRDPRPTIISLWFPSDTLVAQWHPVYTPGVLHKSELTQVQRI